MLKQVVDLLRPLENEGFKGAMCAGGFIRDHTLGLPPKDIDLFIPFQNDGTAQLERRLRRALGGEVTMEFDLSYSADSEVYRVFKAHITIDGVPVQIIELVGMGAPIHERVQRHDFGLCQGYVLADGEVRASPAFLMDVANKTCTLVYVEDAMQYARSMRRWDRWAAGALGQAGFTLVAPPCPEGPFTGFIFDAGDS